MREILIAIFGLGSIFFIGCGGGGDTASATSSSSSSQENTPTVYLKWQEITPENTPTMAEHSIVTIGQDIYLVGTGSEQASPVLRSGLFNEFWRFNPDIGWEEQLADVMPPNRAHHKAVAVNNKMYILFGESDNGLLYDYWEYDPKTKSWKQNKIDTASYAGITLPVEGADIISDDAGGVIWISGGRNEDMSLRSEVVAYYPEHPNLPENHLANAIICPDTLARYDHNAFYHLGSLYILFGNSAEGKQNGIVRVNLSEQSCQQLQPQGPSPAARSGAAGVNVDGSLYVFGGNTSDGSDTQEVWRYVIDKNRWEQLVDMPASPHGAATLKSDATGATKILYHGGYDENGYSNRLYEIYPISYSAHD